MPRSTPLHQLRSSPAAALDGAPVDVIVLSQDTGLFDTVQDAVGENQSVWSAETPEMAVELLVRGCCGVLVIDLATVVFEPDRLVQNVHGQFPGVVICVAGARTDEPLMAPLIGDGRVYRFMHRPLSARRAGMFLQAATRHHLEQREDRVLVPPLPDNLAELPSRLEPLRWAAGAIAVALFVMLVSIFVGDRPEEPVHASTPSPVAPPEPAPTPTPVPEPIASAAASSTEPPVVAPESPPASPAPTESAVVEQPAPVTPVEAQSPAVVEDARDPALTRADEAYAAGRYDSPPGANALDLYRAALEGASAAEARAGLDRTINRMLVGARLALDSGNPAEARRLVDRVLAVDPQRSTAQLLARQLRPPPRAPPPLPTPAAPPPVPPALARSAPVTRLPTAATAPVTAVAPVALQPAPAPVVVRPDPLAAQVSNAADLVRTPRQRIYARAVEPLPIAGYVKSREVEPAVAGPARSDDAAPPPAGPALPADSFERLVVTDPVYPLDALRTKTEGWVQLEFTITASGSVRDVAVVDAQPKGVFDRSAADALARWRFKPRYVNGKPVAQRSTVVIRFNLDS